ncbi:MAG: ATP-binding cassette domain-containing protein [Spirochaetaceae bacterium]|mgnify:FL=1|nr:ATP-binding cassette domain-containing protein [Spirochaetaceae bacterium]MBP3449501.1 ATP-binding cassette domain-containing protein [Spirochaetaceae bacterium]
MIEVEQVSRTFGTFKAVDSISFSIKTGEIVGLLGPNGAGKTTTMRMITGFLDMDSGSIKIDGKDIRENPKESKRKIGYMPESAPLYGEMIVADYLEYVAQMQGVNPKEKVPQLASVCGLTDVMHKNVSDLSRGYRQRVGLAHALMNDPEILILDEPTSGLDPNQIIEVRSLIKEIGKTRTVIISTHILSEVEMICDRVIIISRGKIAADSPTSELRTRYAGNSNVIVNLSGAEKTEFENVISKIEGVCSISFLDTNDTENNLPKEIEKPLIARIGIKDNAEIRNVLSQKIISNGWNLYGLTLETNTLEDVFKTLTTGGEQ